MSRFVSLDRALLMLLLAIGGAKPARGQRLLVPMDDAQQDHLKAYGITYNALKDGLSGEWLLNYRGGAFLLPDTPEMRKRAALTGVTIEVIDDAQLGAIRSEIANSNMETVPLEKAPKIAVYSPPEALPWDDAVTLALSVKPCPAPLDTTAK